MMLSHVLFTAKGVWRNMSNVLVGHLLNLEPGTTRRMKLSGILLANMATFTPVGEPESKVG